MVLRPALLALVLSLVAGSGSAVELRGAVRSAAGAPLPDAHVSIDTAVPRAGVGTLCPWCHPDCAKLTQTDRDGRFAIARLDSALLFRVLVASPGFEPRLIERVDPAAGALAVELKPRPWALPHGAVGYFGSVSDPFGFPVAGAVVTSLDGSGGRSITDERGRFLVVGATHALLVTSREAAPFRLANPPAGEIRIRLTSGVTVEGAVTRQGAPLAGVVVRLSERDEALARGIGPRLVESDENGRFAFPNVAPRDSLRVALLTASLAASGVPPVEVATAQDGSTLAVPPIEWPATPEPAAHRP